MWFVFALTFALSSSFGVILAKKIMQEIKELPYLFITGIFTLPFLLLIVIIFYQIPRVDGIFLLAVLGSIILDVVAAILAYRAIRISEISLVAPISAFNPVFTAIISLIFLGEVIDLSGWLGIITVCAGAYLLQFSKTEKSLFYPVRSLLAHRGVQFSVLAYLLWAITPTLQKTAILHTTPSVPPFVSLSGMLGTTAVFGLFTSRSFIKKAGLDFGPMLKKFLPLLVLVGILGGVGQASAFMAFSLTNLGFATAIFKLSIIFTVIFGWLFFKDRNIKNRLLGSIVMLVGVFLLIT